MLEHSADLDGLGVQVHAVEFVLRDLPVEIQERPLAAEFLQPGEMLWPAFPSSVARNRPRKLSQTGREL